MTAPALNMESTSLTAQADTMEQTIRSSLEETLGPPAAAPTSSDTPETPAPKPAVSGDRARDEAGRFIAQAGEVPAEGAPPVEPEPAAPVIPEGYVATQPLPEEKVRGVVVKDAEGEVLAPDLTWEFTAGNKPRSVDTATLLEYAKMGVYNHEREQARVQTEQQNHQLQSRAAEFEQQATQAKQEIERLLSDPRYLIAAIERYEAENTPEARAARDRQQMEQERRQLELDRMAQQADDFVDRQLTPAVDLILQNLPTVSQEEIAHRLFMVGDRYRVDGVLHPDGFDPMRRALVDDVLPWAKQLHAHRSAERQQPAKDAEQAKAKAKAEADAARVRAQKARRTGTAPLKPGAGNIAGGSQKPVIRNQKNAEEAVIGETLAALRTG